MIRGYRSIRVSLFLIAPICFGQTFTITTVVGDGIQGFAGDGGQALNAEIFTIAQLAVDSSSNIYIADTGNCRIRKVTAATGIITTVAGNGTCGYSGDNGPAISAEIYLPHGVAVDSFGNIYIGDTVNYRVRKVDTNGIITTFAGTGVAGYSGDNGPAVSAQVGTAAGLAVDSSGAVYFADNSNSRIRKIALDGTITTVAGNGTQGFAGNGGPATAASLYFPETVTFDRLGNMYIDEPANDAVRVVSTSGIINVVAGQGNGHVGFSGDGGPGINALLDDPQSVAVDANGNVFISDEDNQRVRMVSPSGIITTICGDGTRNFSGDGGPSTSAQVNLPEGIAVGPTGLVYFIDSSNNRVRVLTPVGTTQTISFSPLPNVTLGAAPFNLMASATSGLAVSFTSNSTSVCTVSGTTATIVGLGTCSISASQLGNSTYAPAQPVTQTFIVSIMVGPVTLNAPSNGASGVSLTPALSWSAASGATSYDVYFGTSSTPPLVNNVTSLSYSPGTLAPAVTYYWQIVAKNSTSSSASSVWSFTTMCTYQLGSNEVTVSAGTGNYSVTVTAPLGCPWTATGTVNWVGITSGTGTGNGAAMYTVTANSGGYRSTELGIAGQGLAVNQLAQRLANITDFDGDGKADLAIFRPSTGLWSIEPSSTGGSSISAAWGVPGDISVVGDFDGDKVLDFAVYRPSTGTWYIVPSSTGVPYAVGWGLAGDVPIAADYDGDGKTDLAVWRPSNQTWYVIPSSNPSVPIVKTWGVAGDQPVQGDFDGDGKKDFAVYRPSTGAWYIIPSSTGVAYGVAWGIPGDEPVPADFDGDGKTDLAVFRSSAGTWYVIPSSTGSPMSRNWGVPGDQPVLLDYDGDHKTDFTIYRPSTQTWYVIQSSTGTVVQQQYGIPNDIPLYRPWPWQ